MAIRCPYCRSGIGLKAPKPGRFATKCPKCAKKFVLIVADDPLEEPVVQTIPSEIDRDATMAGPEVTMAQTEAGTAAPVAAPADPNATGAWAPTQVGPDPNATGAWAGTQPGGDPNATGGWTPSQAGTRPTRPPGPEETAAQGFDLATGAGPTSGVVDDPQGEVPATLGGYQVIRELGRGGMGAVYLARQLSLDRNVALKVMRPEWASNPTFLSRFTREAYAAAQLVHHNVVQIYDFGEDKGTNYFSMEYVKGQTLAQLVRDQKKLDPEVAVGYILQAARGLKFAHDQSMIHRDIKPDNLMLNDQGVVKVADLGLVKTPASAEAEIALETGTATVAPPTPGRTSLASSSGQITMANVAMGTPAFMAPEQGRDAAGVDARADIYSLGCTLYDLVTGRPPFEGKTAMELITKHQSEVVVPPERLAKRVPKSLSDVIVKMIAKKPEDRYPDLGEVIKAFEEYLGLSTTGPFTPREEHANQLGESVVAFNSAPTARLRPKVLLGGAAVCAVAVIGCLLGRQLFLAGGFLGLGLMTAAALFLIQGFRAKTPLFLKTRAVILGSSPGDWLMIAAGVVLFLIILVVLKLLWAWVAFGIVAVLLAFGYHAAIDRRVVAERREAIEDMERMLRSMRLHGLEEDVLRQFVCKYSGEHWEEFYEALFGYEAMLTARDRWGRGERGLPRKRFAAWRDPIITALDAKQQSRRAAREQKLLQKIEEKGLEAQGVNLVTARRKAHRAAEAMVAMAAEIKAESRKVPAERSPDRKAIGKALRQAAERPEDVLVAKERGLYGDRTTGPLDLLIGGKTRFLVGAALLAGCLMWMQQNNIISSAKIKEAAANVQEAAKKAAESKDVNSLRDVKTAGLVNQEAIGKAHAPLQFPGLPGVIRRLFNGFGPGVAGLVLVVSACFRGARMSYFALPAAAIALLGPKFGIPSIGPIDKATISMALAGALAVVGILFGRTRR